MVKLENAVIARLEREGDKFEILVDPDLAMALKKNKPVNFEELLAVDSVFKDAKKGELQSDALLDKVFKTKNINEISKIIILKGQVQLTTEQKRKIIENKRKEIVNYLVVNTINPQTKAPNSMQIIETALKEAGIHVDPFKTVSEQIMDIISKLKKIIPISIEKLRIAVKIPAKYSGKALSAMHTFEVKKQDWLSDGSVVILFELPAGLKLELINKVNKLTQGEASVKILENEK